MNNRAPRLKLALDLVRCRLARLLPEHVANHLGQDLAGFAMDDSSGDVVERGGLGVDDAQIGAVLSGQSWNARRRVHLERAANDQYDICRHRQRLRVAQRHHRKGLPEEDDGWFEEAAAAGRTARWAVLAVQPVRLVSWEACLTIEADDRAR